VQPSALCPNPSSVNGFRGLAIGVLVAAAPPDPLVAARAEGSAAVLQAGAVPGQQHGPDVWGHAGVVQRAIQLVDGVRAEGVAHLRAVEGDAHGALGRPVQSRPVVGDISEVEALHQRPGTGVEDLAHPVFIRAVFIRAVFAHPSDNRRTPGRPCARQQPPNVQLGWCDGAVSTEEERQTGVVPV